MEHRTGNTDPFSHGNFYSKSTSMGAYFQNTFTVYCCLPVTSYISYLCHRSYRHLSCLIYLRRTSERFGGKYSLFQFLPSIHSPDPLCTCSISESFRAICNISFEYFTSRNAAWSIFLTRLCRMAILGT